MKIATHIHFEFAPTFMVAPKWPPISDVSTAIHCRSQCSITLIRSAAYDSLSEFP